MSVIYPSINSKGISCFPKSEHGAVAGVILFFTCVSTVASPLAMGAAGDAEPVVDGSLVLLARPNDMIEVKQRCPRGAVSCSY